MEFEIDRLKIYHGFPCLSLSLSLSLSLLSHTNTHTHSLSLYQLIISVGGCREMVSEITIFEAKHLYHLPFLVDIKLLSNFYRYFFSVRQSKRLLLTKALVWTIIKMTAQTDEDVRISCRYNIWPVFCGSEYFLSASLPSIKGIGWRSRRRVKLPNWIETGVSLPIFFSHQPELFYELLRNHGNALVMGCSRI